MSARRPQVAVGTPVPHEIQARLATLTPHQRCMVVLESSPALAQIIRTVWASGAALALLKPTTTAQHQRALSAAYDPHLVVRSTNRGGILVEEAPAGRHPDPVTSGSITVFTSGTTGAPKGVVIGRDAVVGNAVKTARLHGFGSNRPHGTCLALFHVNALMMSLLGTLITGESLLVDYSGSANGYFATLANGGARTASANPQVLRRIVEERPPWPKALDYVITAAGPCSKNLASEFYGLYGPRLRQGYGMSEAVNFSFMMPTITEPEEFERLYIRARPPVGLPLEGTEYVIESGELIIRTPDVMSGYLHAPNPRNMRDGWLHTGDFAEVREEHVVLLGRTSERLSAPGLSPAPGHAEDQLDLSVQVGDYAVVQIANRPSVALFTSGPIAATAALRIRDTPLPVSVVCSRALRLTQSGKIERRLMSETASTLLSLTEDWLGRRGHRRGQQMRGLAAAVTHALPDVSARGLRPTTPLACGCEILTSSSLTATSPDPACGEHTAEAVWRRSDTEWLLSHARRTHHLPVHACELVRSVRGGDVEVALMRRSQS